jgi:hypothetical protein
MCAFARSGSRGVQCASPFLPLPPVTSPLLPPPLLLARGLTPPPVRAADRRVPPLVLGLSRVVERVAVPAWEPDAPRPAHEGRGEGPGEGEEAHEG